MVLQLNKLPLGESDKARLFMNLLGLLSVQSLSDAAFLKELSSRLESDFNVTTKLFSKEEEQKL